MATKWDSEFTEEKLQSQIQKAKEKWKEFRFKLEKVYYIEGAIYFDMTDGSGLTENYCFSKNHFKCLEGVKEEDLEQVSLLGDRAIQWEKLDIQICVDKLLLGVQKIDDWVKDLGE